MKKKKIKKADKELLSTIELYAINDGYIRQDFLFRSLKFNSSYTINDFNASIKNLISHKLIYTDTIDNIKVYKIFRNNE